MPIIDDQFAFKKGFRATKAAMGDLWHRPGPTGLARPGSTGQCRGPRGIAEPCRKSIAQGTLAPWSQPPTGRAMTKVHTCHAENAIAQLSYLFLPPDWSIFSLTIRLVID